MPKEVILKKIPVKMLLEAIIDLYNRGVEYIDITGTPGKEQDYVGISFNRNYIMDKNDEYFFEKKEEGTTIKPTSEDYLNLLI